MWFGIVSLFPEMFAALEKGITGRALQNQLIQIEHWNPRDFTHDNHKTVDDKPYGGGAGMVMLAEPLTAALRAASQAAPTSATKIFLSPQGKKFDQEAAERLLQKQSLVFLVGRYEGVDERVIDTEIDEEWSIGDYILSGGELAAMVMIDAITRLIPTAVNTAASISTDSLSSGLLKYPQYSRPEVFNSQNVPEVLLSGNHKLIKRWRQKQSLARTWLRRADLLAKKTLNTEELALLNEFIREYLQ